MSGRGRGGRGSRGRGGFGGRGGGPGGFNSDIDYATMLAFNKAEKEKALFPPMEPVNTSEPTPFEKLAYQYNRTVEIPLFRSPYFFVPSQTKPKQLENGLATGDDEIDSSLYGDLHLLDIHGNIMSRARQISRLRSSLTTKQGQAWARSVWDEENFPPKLWTAAVNSVSSSTSTLNATNRKFKPNMKSTPSKKRVRDEENNTTSSHGHNKEDVSFSLEDGTLEIGDNDPLNLFPEDDDGTNPLAGGADSKDAADKNNPENPDNNDEGNNEDEMDNYEDDEGEDDYDNNYFDNGEDDDFGDLGIDGGGDEAEY